MRDLVIHRGIQQTILITHPNGREVQLITEPSGYVTLHDVQTGKFYNQVTATELTGLLNQISNGKGGE